MNVVLLVVDSLRDDMPWNGYARDIAPNLTRLFAEAVSWERGYAVSSFTAKSVPAILAGRYPSSLRRTTAFFTRYRDGNPFLAEQLHERGIRTLGAHAHMYFKTEAGFHQGFDTWQMAPGIEWDVDKDPYVTSPAHVKLAIEQLSRMDDSQARFFAYYHFMDPHDVYHAHEGAPAWGSKPRDLYDAEVWFTDRHVRDLVDFVRKQPWGERTAIVVTSDHGEAFGEHSLRRHGYELYEVLVRVPLFVLLPGVEPRRVPRWRSHIDLAPTILELLGVPVPDDLPGRSLVPEMTGPAAPERPVVCDLPADVLNVRHRALIDEQGRKLIAFGHDVRYELYDVRRDPGEGTDLFRRDRALADAMVRRYKQISKAIPFAKAEGGRPVKAD
jgi:arylsulfatase A-like enzyme